MIQVIDNLPIHERINFWYNWGDLLEAEKLAKESPDLDISKTVLKRMEDIRSWNKYGKPHGYCDPESWESMPKFQKSLDKIQETFGNQGVHVLDVGCFTGYFSRHLNELGYEAHGCDIQHKLMNILNVRFCLGKVKFHPVSGENIGRYFKKGIFDVITFLDSLEHILDDRIAIQSAIGLLNRGGLLIIHVPQGEKYADDSHEHLRLYNVKNLRELVPGITIEEMEDEHGQPTFFGWWKKGMIL